MRLVEVAPDLPQHTLDLLELMAICDAPFESCGVVLKDGSVCRYENVCDEPEHGFDATLEHDLEAVDIIWHSHPNGLQWPSRQDMPTIEEVTGYGHEIRWGIITPGGHINVYVMK
ncbi:hypothetical protein SEA_AIKOY__23 [Mycobacterium phage Aikoy]|uniref:JAB domain-containing protein n=1 Tax=Mycobacterium phage Onyinye TaxID=2686235 RepID=A0A6B9L7E7_9CAUD|nr:minor tail protein [Mycobacterium phage Onyinye]QHB37430.1 hypothetical protein SEA_ONYINYE_24 [Mycobacterium phage Onyinye]WKW85185.1 hypothetical protein SEA_AIKOY__23 [Mycobacterium phage Aikoy]